MTSRRKLRNEGVKAKFPDLDESEVKWLSEVGGSAQRGYPRKWREFKKFLGAKGLPTTGEEILDLRDKDLTLPRRDPNRWRFEDLALEFYNSLWEFSELGVPKNTDRGKLAAVQSFFSHHRMNLQLKRGDITKAVTLEEKYEFTLQDLDAVKKFGNPTERWIFFGGKSVGQRVNIFARIKKSQIESRLDEEPPIPIDLITRKIGGVVAHPCLDRDAVEAAKDLLAYLKTTSHKDNPYMLPGKIANTPMSQGGINKAVKRVAGAAHAADPSLFQWREKKQSLRFHGLRAFLTGAFQNAHIDKDLREWIVGHKLSDTSKAYTTHERRKAYVDAEKFLLLPRPRFDLDLTPEQEKKVKGLIQLGMLRRSTSEPEEVEEVKKKQVRVISEDEIENHLNHGWTFVTVLPSGKILIQRG